MHADSDSSPETSDDSTGHETPESKSQRKRAARQITDLAAELVEMKPKVLAGLPLEQTVREAINECAEIKAHGARKRQLHFVSKLLRETDNIEEITQWVRHPDRQRSSVNPHLSFRDKLLVDVGDHVDELRERYPEIDLQQVRQLVRNAHQEARKANNKKSALAADGTQIENKAQIDSTKSAKALLKLLSG